MRTPLLAATLAAACGPVIEIVPCTEDVACRDAFGAGHVCAEDGFCDMALPPDRCTPWPEDAFDEVDAETSPVVLATLFDHAAKGPRVRAARLAVAQANERTGLGGRAFALWECDLAVDERYDDLDRDGAIEAVAPFLTDAWGVPAVVGPSASSATEVAYQAFSPAGTVVVSPAATSPALTPLDGLTSTDAEPGLLWRTAPPDDLQGAVIAREIDDELALSTVHVIAEQGAYGEGLAEVFIESSSADARLSLFSDTTELASAIVTAAGRDPEGVLFISGDVANAVAFLNGAAGNPAFDETTFFMTDGARKIGLIEEVSEDARPLLARVRGTVPKTPQGRLAYDAFATSYRLEFEGEDPGDDGFTAHAYDAAWMVLYGTAWSQSATGSIQGVDIARAFRQLTDGEPVNVGPSGWSTVQARFAAGDPVDLVGASGDLAFDPVTGETVAPIDVWTVDLEADAFETAYCWDLSASPDPDCRVP